MSGRFRVEATTAALASEPHVVVALTNPSLPTPFLPLSKQARINSAVISGRRLDRLPVAHLTPSIAARSLARPISLGASELD